MKLKFSLGARIAPRWTVAKAAELFTTPMRPKADKLATPQGVPPPRQQQYDLAAGSVTTYVWGEPASQPTALLLHGWNGWGMQLAAFVPPLLERGYAVVALDHVGHGASPGKRSSLPVFIDSTREMIGRLPHLSAVIGHSMGAASAACALVEASADGIDLVLIAPPKGPRVFIEQFTRALGLPFALADGVQGWIERRYGRSFEAVGVESIAPRLNNRTLVLHDPLDNVVPIAHGEAYARLAPDARLETLADCGHYKVLRAPKTVMLAMGFLTARRQQDRPKLVRAA